MCVRRISAAFVIAILAWQSFMGTAQTKSFPPAQPAQTTSLTVNVLDLPEGVPAQVRINSVGGNVGTLAKPGTVSVAPGSYTVSATPVHIGNATYYPTAPTQQVTVGQGASTITVDYYNIVPDTTRVLDAEGARTLMVSEAGTHISIGAGSAVARSLRVGGAVAIAPTIAAPHGMLAKVIAVRTADGRIEADVRRASVLEAITRGRFSATIIYSPDTLRIRNLVGHDQGQLSFSQAKSRGLVGGIDGAREGCSQAVPAVEIPFNYSLGPEANGPFGTSASAGLTLSGSTSLCPNLDVAIDWGFLHINSAKVVAQLGEETSVAASAQASVSVDGSVDLLQLETGYIVVVVAGVPIVLQGEATLTLGADIEAVASFTASTTQTASAELGLEYQHGQVSPIQGANFSIQPLSFARNASISGEAYAELKLGVLVEGVLLPNIVPKVYLSWDSTPPATLDFGLKGAAGIDVQVAGHHVLSVNTPELTLFEKTIWQAPSVPPPTLNSIQPPSADAGSRTEQLTLSGANFGTDAVVLADGKPLITTYYSSGMLSTTMPTAKMATPETVELSAFDPDSGATSQTVGFQIVSPVPGPVISNLIPATAQAGAPAQTLAIYGSGFLPSTTVTFSGLPHTAIYDSGSQVSISLTGADVAKVGSYPVVVTNSDVNGPLSYSVQFPVGEAMKPVLGSAMQGMNPQRTNTATAAGPTRVPAFLAIANLRSGSVLRRVDSDGTNIVTSPGGNCGPAAACRWVTAYKPDGRVKWDDYLITGTGYDFADVAIASSGTVYLLDPGNATLIALSGSNGSVIWSAWANYGTIGGGGLIIDSSGTIYLQSYATVTAITPEGAVKWSTTKSATNFTYAPPPPTVLSVMSEDGQVIYWGSGLSYPNWVPQSTPEGFYYYSADGTAATAYTTCLYPTYVAARNGIVAALLWSGDFGLLSRDLTSCMDMGKSAGGYEAFTNQGVLVFSNSGAFSGYSSSGNLLWTRLDQLGNGFADKNGVLYEVVLSPSNNQYQIEAVNSQDGTLLWQYTFPERVTDSPIYNQVLMGPDGSLYFASGTTLYRAKAGRTLINPR
jgi:outer membrane protein assembly factor BamB